MRQFDNRQSWLDNEGKPLIGRVSFYRKGTSVLEIITDISGTSLANPILTNTLGQTVSQVFLQDNKDYTINFEKYIGNGDYTQDEEITNWEFQYSCDNLYDVYGIDVDCDGVQAVNTINDLQNFDPALVANERNYIQVLGYNELGDCEPVYYIWNSNSVASTNGGSIIASNVVDTGRWELVDTFVEVFDVRHFGVFGAQTRQLAEVAMGAQIVLAQQYANSIGKVLYFPAIENDTTWYNFQSVPAISNAKFDSRVYVFDDLNQTHYITCTDDSDYNVYGDAIFHIIASTVRTKWGKDGTNVIYEPRDVLYIDTTVATSNKTISNVIVKASRFVEGWTFDTCRFELIERLYANCTFNNCYLIQQLFTPLYQTNTFTVDDDCVIDLKYFDNMDLYIQLREQQSSRILDLEGKTLSRMPNWTDTITLSNATLLETVRFKANIVNLKNVLGVFRHTNASINTLNISDSTLLAYFPTQVDYITLNNTEVTNQSLSANTINQKLLLNNNSILNGAVLVNCNNVCEVNNSTLNEMVFCSNGFTADNSNLLKKLQVKNVFIINKCTIKALIEQVSNVNLLTCSVQNCIFTEDGYHYIASEVPNTTVNGIWINNTNLGGFFVYLDRTNLNADDTVHTYVYENNYGAEQSDNIEWKDTVHFNNSLGNQKWLQYEESLAQGNIQTSDTPPTYISVSIPEELGNFSFHGKNTTGNYGTTDPSYYLSTFNMFTIGTTNIKPLTLWGELYLQPEYYESTHKVSRQNIIPNKIMLGSRGKSNVGAYPWNGDGEYEGYPAGFMKDPNSLYGWIITDAPKIFRTEHKTNWWQALTVDINVKWFIKR